MAKVTVQYRGQTGVVIASYGDDLIIHDQDKFDEEIDYSSTRYAFLRFSEVRRKMMTEQGEVTTLPDDYVLFCLFDRETD